MFERCQIRWIDADGKSTPDHNEAIGHVRMPARVEQRPSGPIKFSATKWFPICAEHAKQLDKPEMSHWEFRAL
jgi:hypothetical protein